MAGLDDYKGARELFSLLLDELLNR